MNRLNRLALPALLLCGAAAAQTEPVPATPVDLDVRFESHTIDMRVTTMPSMFLGGILWSLGSETASPAPGLPPLLTDSVVLGIGLGHHGEYRLTRSRRFLDYGLPVYAQGLAADAQGLRASAVVELSPPPPEQ